MWGDHAALKVARELKPPDRFIVTFDFGDGWRHECRVLSEKPDPREELGAWPLPRGPVAVWGGA